MMKFLLFPLIHGLIVENSNYMMRIHKNFIKDVMDKNFKVILDHIESKNEKDITLKDFNAKIDDIEIQIQPHNGDMTTELFFDDGQIVMEIEGLEFVGKGRITDPESGV